MMNGVLTWPAYGTWLSGASHGRIEECSSQEVILPEPDEALSIARRQGLKWPVVKLSESQHRTVVADLTRMAGFRPFEVHCVVAANDHVHALLSIEEHANVHQVIQLIKGSTARALTVAAGDQLARSSAGKPLLLHKWWSRQYVFQRLIDAAAYHRAGELMELHGR